MPAILHQYAKKLRKRTTDTEALLWSRLRNKRFEGLKWRRQEPIGRYIVDFVCYEKRLVIECDGSQHIQDKDKDEIRDRWFESQGFRVLRFWDPDVLKNIDDVVEAIFLATKTAPSP